MYKVLNAPRRSLALKINLIQFMFSLGLFLYSATAYHPQQIPLEKVVIRFLR